MMKFLTALTVLILTGVGVSSCNLFSPLDHPSGDAQDLSRARACFDTGDLDCARKYYEKLSPGYQDTAIAELSFIVLKQNGAGMSAYMQFVGDMVDSNKGMGPALTNFANRMIATSGQTARLAIWGVYNDTVNPSSGDYIQGTDLRNFVSFVSMVGLSAEILAEAATNGTLKTSDVAANATTCSTLTTGTCGNAACDVATDGSALGVGAYSHVNTTAPSGASPVIGQLYESIQLALNSLNSLSAGGKFTTATNAFNNISQALTLSGGNLTSEGVGDQCVRNELLVIGVGST